MEQPSAGAIRGTPADGCPPNVPFPVPTPGPCSPSHRHTTADDGCHRILAGPRAGRGPDPARFSLAPAATLPGYVVSPSSARETAGSDDEAAGGGRHAPRSMVHAARDVTALCRQQQLSQGRGPDSQPSMRRFEPGRNLHDGPGCALCLARGPRIGPTDLISFDTIHRRR
jgi:hypothetical protein